MGWPPVPQFPAAAAAANTGPGITDPRRMPQAHATATALLVVSDVAGTQTNSTSSTFFSIAGGYGANTDTNFTASTYQTIATVSGPSIVLFAAAIGPTASGSETTTFRITRDGTAQEIPVAVTIGRRAVIGQVQTNGMYASALNNVYYYGAFDTNRTVLAFATGIPAFLSPPNLSETFCADQFLSCESSLTVEIKHSVSITATAAMNRQAAALYIRKY